MARRSASRVLVMKQTGGSSGGLTSPIAESDVTNLTTDLAAKQPLDTELTALAGLTSAADKLPYFTGSGAAALATFAKQGRSLVAPLVGSTSLTFSVTGDFESHDITVTGAAAGDLCEILWPPGMGTVLFGPPIVGANKVTLTAFDASGGTFSFTGTFTALVWTKPAGGW